MRPLSGLKAALLEAAALVIGIGLMVMAVWVFVQDTVYHRGILDEGQSLFLVAFGGIGAGWTFAAIWAIAADARNYYKKKRGFPRRPVDVGKPYGVRFCFAAAGVSGAFGIVLGTVSSMAGTDLWGDERKFTRLFLLGAVLLVGKGFRELRRLKNEAAARVSMFANGHCVMATVTDVPAMQPEPGGPGLFVVDCSYDDEHGFRHYFRSEVLTTDPGTELIGSEIRVYLESPGMYGKYYVDVSPAGKAGTR